MTLLSIEEARRQRARVQLAGCAEKASELLYLVHTISEELDVEKPPNSAEFVLNLRAWADKLNAS